MDSDLVDAAPGSSMYPDVSPISLTHKEFPTTFNKLERSGLPFGAEVRPFVGRCDESQEQVVACTSALSIARCGQCSAYLNPYCELTSTRWFCSVCSFRNIFSKSMTRYRVKGNGDGTFEECANALGDYPMPYREIDGAPSSNRGKYAIPASRRPLVHVFMVQESMSIDALKCSIKSIRDAVKDMHPDIKIVLLSYSDRLGVYRLGSSGRASGGAMEVSYIQLAGNEGRGTPLHGNSGALTADREGKCNSVVGATCPVGLRADFLGTAVSVGEPGLREDLDSALEGLVTAFHRTAGSMMPMNGNDSGLSVTPESCLGPCLDEVCQWICEDTDMSQAADHINGASDGGVVGNLYAGDSDEDEDAAMYGQEDAEAAPESGGVMGLLQDIGLGLVGAGQLSKGVIGSQKEEEPAKNRREGPIDSCSGVVLHLFTGSAQDLPPGSHSSTKQHGQGLNYFWAEELGSAVSSHGLAVNVWGIASFEDSPLDLFSLSRLARQTGGQLHRIVLGSYPADENARMTEILRRSICSRQLATKGVLKIRASPSINVLEESLSGPYAADTHYPGVYHLPQCSQDAALCLQIEYKNVDPSANLNPEDRGNRVCFQMAFSYDTLVESAATTESAAMYNVDKKEKESDVDEYLQTMAEILEIDRGNDTAGDQEYRSAIESALSQVTANKQEMCLTVKDNNFARNMHFLLKHSNEIVMQQQQEEEEMKEEEQGGVKHYSGEEKRGGGVAPGVVHEMRKVLQGKASDFWRCAALGSEANPALNCYDRRRRLLAVRRLRIFTIVVPCTSRASSLVSSLQPAALSALIVRQAITDEIRFRESLLAAHDEGHSISAVPNSDIPSPGMHFVDGWAASVVAACASLDKAAKESPSYSCQEAMDVSVVARTLQLLYGARKRFIESRAAARDIAYRSAQGLGAANRHSKFDMEAAVARIVTDHFAEWSAHFLSVSCNASQRLLYPALLPLSVHASQSTRGKRGDQLQWVIDRTCPLPLKWESLTYRNSHAFLMDAGDMIILYKSSTPPVLGLAPPAPTPRILGDSVPPPPPPPVLPAAPSLASDPASTPAVVRAGPRAETGGFGFKALDVLGHIDRGVGRLIGDPSFDDSFEGTSSGEVESKTNDKLGASAGDKGEDVDVAQLLSQEQSWLPYDAFKHITYGSLVPRVIVAEKEANEAPPPLFQTLLLEDTPDITGDPYTCESYGRFLLKACTGAEEETIELIK